MRRCRQGHVIEGVRCRLCLRAYQARWTTPEYSTWRTMKQRCQNPRTAGFEYYGGRGIKVCDRWRNSFENFLADMGPRPSEAHSIERKDNAADYTPENCVWATAKEQATNRRTTKLSGVAVLCIRILRQRGASVRTLAGSFGVSGPTISNVMAGRNW